MYVRVYMHTLNFVRSEIWAKLFRWKLSENCDVISNILARNDPIKKRRLCPSVFFFYLLESSREWPEDLILELRPKLPAAPIPSDSAGRKDTTLFFTMHRFSSESGSLSLAYTDDIKINTHLLQAASSRQRWARRAASRRPSPLSPRRLSWWRSVYDTHTHTYTDTRTRARAESQAD